jgi:hypothetical protein
MEDKYKELPSRRGTDSILVGVIVLFDRSIHHIPKIIGFYRLVLAQDTDFSFAYSMYSYINAQEVKAKLQNSQRDKIGVFLSSFSSRTVPEHCIVRAPFLHGGLGIPHAGQTSQASQACVSAPPPLAPVSWDASASAIRDGPYGRWRAVQPW